MNAAHTILISPGDFDHSVEIGKLRADSNGIGADVTFTGLVRDNNLDDGVTGLALGTSSQQSDSPRWSADSR